MCYGNKTNEVLTTKLLGIQMYMNINCKKTY